MPFSIHPRYLGSALVGYHINSMDAVYFSVADFLATRATGK